MPAKKGNLKPMDAFEESIRNRAVSYNVVMFQPGKSSRVYQSFTELDMAIEYSKTVLNEPNRIRSAMIYAIDKDQHHALVGTVNRHDLAFKKVEPKHY
jgi:hypothetical protein